MDPKDPSKSRIITPADKAAIDRLSQRYAAPARERRLADQVDAWLARAGRPPTPATAGKSRREDHRTFEEIIGAPPTRSDDDSDGSDGGAGPPPGPKP